ncbi:MAG: ferrous iron transport protein A [Oscillospiraceae bacterium]|nr:ferrous iron transport protein A [Oscillospiraceae bacterium]
MSIPLHTLPCGRSATVLHISDGCRIRRRLQDIGLIEGTPVRALFAAPSGDPVAYAIRGAVIALRRGDAAQVEVINETP